MTICSIIEILVFIFLIFYKNFFDKRCDIKFYAFIIMLFFSIFVNIGFVFSRIESISYSILAECLFILICLFTDIHTTKLNRNAVVLSFLCVIILFFGLINLVLNPYLPKIIPMTISIDSVFLGENKVQSPNLSSSNIFYMFSFMLFLVVVNLSLPLFKRGGDMKVLFAIRKMFYIMFFLWFIEFLFNNLISNQMWRDLIYKVFGSVEGKTFNGVKRYGFYGFSGFFSEQSYISVMLIFYVIEYVLGISSKTDYLLHLCSIVLLILNSSTTGIILLPFGVYTLFVDRKRRIKKKTIYRLFVSIFIGIIVFIIFTKAFPSIYNKIIELTTTKLRSYFNNNTTNNTASVSAKTRSFGNKIAWDAFFKSPILGVGIGTTRGYGVWSGAFACFGLAGIVFYFLAMFKCFDITRISCCDLYLIILVYLHILLQ